jgi:hypothetical protein
LTCLKQLRARWMEDLMMRSLGAGGGGGGGVAGGSANHPFNHY